MKVAVIADVHCRGPSDPAQQKFIAWLRTLEVDQLWLLGDVFHYGWVFQRDVQPIFQEVVDALREARDRGVQILFVPGNHDFAVASVLQREAGAEVRGEHIRTVDGVRIALAHGDELDQTWRYRTFRSLIRSRLVAFTVRCLGQKLGSVLLAKLAGDVSQGDEVWEKTRDGVMRRLEQADVVVIGHVHTPWHHVCEDGTAVILHPGRPLFLEDGNVLTERHE